MSWVELQLPVLRGSIARVSHILFQLGALGLQEDFLPGEEPPVRQPWDDGPPHALPPRALIRAWWGADETDLQARVAVELHAIEGLGEARWLPVMDEGWAEAWRSQCQRILVEDDLVVAPPWKAQPGDLIIEPGMAFGTGEHPTTLSCLRSIYRNAKPGERCLDVGTGSGVLAIAAARRGMDAWGIDIDPESVVAALGNANRNHVLIRADQTPLHDVVGQFELVVANLFAEVIVSLSSDLKRVCSQHLAVAGVLTDRADTVVASLSPMEMLSRVEEGDWTHLEFGW